MSRPKFIAAFLLAVAFTVGGLSGMALEEALGIDWFEFLDEDDADNSLLEGMSLTHEQRSAAEAILEREEDRLEEYWESRIPEIQTILQQTYAEVRATLPAEQHALFDRRVQELRGRVPSEIRD